jgi:two-component system response regulator FixJ
MHFVHIVDDDNSVRASLYTLLSTRPNLGVRSFKSGDDFLDQLDQLDGGVVLLDIHMPGASGFDVLRVLRDDDRAFATVVITGQGDIGMAVQAMKLGAVDFLEKPYSPDVLFGSIETCIDRLDRQSSATEKARAAKARVTALSDRELEVLLNLIEGCSNKQVAINLNVSPRTIEVHRANLMTKLEVHNLPEAVRLAFSAGLITDA